MRAWILLTLWLTIPLLADAGNMTREGDYADQAASGLQMGDIIELGPEGRRFWGIYTPTVEAEAYGTAVILHDRGGFPDRRPVVHGLRTTLPQHHFATLSIQLPLLEQGASESDYFVVLPEAGERIAASIDYLHDSGERNIVIVGYGLGALAALHHFADDASAISALAAISLPVPDSRAESAQTLEFLAKISVPVLDIFGEHDLPEVVNSARRRRQAANENPHFRQIELDAENHSFKHNGERLVKRVYSWLRRGFKPH